MRSLFSVKLPKRFALFLIFASCLTATASEPDEARDGAPPTADLMLGQKPGQVRDDNALKLKLVWCPRGSFMMGDLEIIKQPAAKGDESDESDPEDKPVREPGVTINTSPVKVLLTRGFWLGKYEVTQSEWKQVMATEPWKDQEFTKEGSDFPATFVNWQEAMEFCRAFTEKERQAGRLPDGWEYTLPTEAQWERACRARTEAKFGFGDDESTLGEYAWYRNNAWQADEKYAHRVGQKRPNSWGLYDMHGNVWEWCRDWYGPSQRPAPANFRLPGGLDPEVTKEDFNKVLRGGGWGFIARDCRSAARDCLGPLNRNGYAGFRVALSAVRQGKT
jgi:formylglycine-generating enzyme required for sulfatase activity